MAFASFHRGTDPTRVSFDSVLWRKIHFRANFVRAAASRAAQSVPCDDDVRVNLFRREDRLAVVPSTSPISRWPSRGAIALDRCVEMVFWNTPGVPGRHTEAAAPRFFRDIVRIQRVPGIPRLPKVRRATLPRPRQFVCPAAVKNRSGRGMYIGAKGRGAEGRAQRAQRRGQSAEGRHGNRGNRSVSAVR
jgi:hypothetical protein